MLNSSKVAYATTGGKATPICEHLVVHDGHAVAAATNRFIHSSENSSLDRGINYVLLKQLDNRQSTQAQEAHCINDDEYAYEEKRTEDQQAATRHTVSTR